MGGGVSTHVKGFGEINGRTYEKLSWEMNPNTDLKKKLENWRIGWGLRFCGFCERERLGWEGIDMSYLPSAKSSYAFLYGVRACECALTSFHIFYYVDLILRFVFQVRAYHGSAYGLFTEKGTWTFSLPSKCFSHLFRPSKTLYFQEKLLC